MAFQDFLDDCCNDENGAQTAFSELYAAYSRWRRGRGGRPLSTLGFAKQLSEAGYGSKKGPKGVRLRVGIRLRGKGVAGEGGSLDLPPEHLQEDTARWYAWIVREFELGDTELPTLAAAAELWDRSCKAREEIDREGMTYRDRFGQPKIRPEVGIERHSKLAFARLMRELGLDPAAPAGPRGLPPAGPRGLPPAA